MASWFLLPSSDFERGTVCGDSASVELAHRMGSAPEVAGASLDVPEQEVDVNAIELGARADNADSQSVSEFLAIVSDAVSHRYLDGEQFWPDSWQMLVDLANTKSVWELLNEDAELKELFSALFVFGYERNWHRWSA